MMKKIFLLIVFFIGINTGFSQDISGEWHGILKTPMQELPVVFHVEKTKTGYATTLDSPKQGAFGIPMGSTVFKNDSLFITSKLNISYRGAFNKSTGITGKFIQNGFPLPLNLSREKSEMTAAEKTKEFNRPQEPTKPYPYISENTRFENTKAGITLAGTLTLPDKKGKFPAVILISGSGPQNRNGEVLGHKPFLVLSDHLTRHGIAVLRYDERSIGESGGNFQGSTSADFATDVQAAVDYLLGREEIDPKAIGLIGHSEGGMIAPMVAAKSNAIGYLVLLAGPGIQGKELLALQNKLLAQATGMAGTQLENYVNSQRNLFEMAANSTDLDTLKSDLQAYFDQKPEIPAAQTEMIIRQLSSPWMHYFIQYDPATALQKVKVPVLALNGTKDLQVAPAVNLEAIEKNLKKGGNTNVTTKLLPGLNHLFQESKTGLPSEYQKIEQTFSPKAMEIITTWITEQTR